MMLLLSRSHRRRSPEAPPPSTELPSQQKHLQQTEQNQKQLQDVWGPSAPHLCSSSAFTDDITIPVCTSVTFRQRSAPTLRTCRLSEDRQAKVAFQFSFESSKDAGSTPDRRTLRFEDKPWSETPTWTEGRVVDGPTVAADLLQRGVAVGVPDGDGPVLTARDQQRPCCVQAQRVDLEDRAQFVSSRPHLGGVHICLHSPQSRVPAQPAGQTGTFCGWRSCRKDSSRPVKHRRQQ